MSEKGARYCLKLLRDELPDGIDKVLAEDPDVVAVARVCRGYKPGLAKTRGGKLYNEGWKDAVNAVADNLERKFGFTLTVDGYEWTDDDAQVD